MGLRVILHMHFWVKQGLEKLGDSVYGHTDGGRIMLFVSPLNMLPVWYVCVCVWTCVNLGTQKDKIFFKNSFFYSF